MTLFDTAWALIKEEGQRRAVKPHALEELGNRTSISFGEGIDDATAFMNLPLKTVVNFKGDAKQRIGPNPPKPNDETGWHQVAHIPEIRVFRGYFLHLVKTQILSGNQVARHLL